MGSGRAFCFLLPLLYYILRAVSTDRSLFFPIPLPSGDGVVDLPVVGPAEGLLKINARQKK
jgi:hypothetical protein